MSGLNKTVIGRVGELRRYPVKSMLGEMIKSADVLSRGLPGDRVCALIDQETGKVASAKSPQRWRRLLECSATYNDRADAVEIALPNGDRFDATAKRTEATLSEFLGRSVKVAFSRPENLELDRANPDEVAEHGATSTVGGMVLQIGKGAPGGGFFDAVPIHLITAASLQRVADRSLAKKPEPVRFRPNIVIEDGPATPFLENDWTGATLSIGKDLRLMVVQPTPRCAIPTLSHGDIGPDRRLTMEIAALNKVQVLEMGMLACLGAYALVQRAGAIAVGDEVILTAPR